MYYTEHKQMNKNGGGLGTRLLMSFTLKLWLISSQVSRIVRPGLARHMPGQSTMFILLMQHETNGLVYSRCLANTNTMVTPLGLGGSGLGMRLI